MKPFAWASAHPLAALRMLAEGGWPINDVSIEIDRIQARAFDQASELADATGDAAAVRERIGAVRGAMEAAPKSTQMVCPPASGGAATAAASSSRR